jgi:hypothetical protein
VRLPRTIQRLPQPTLLLPRPIGRLRCASHMAEVHDRRVPTNVPTNVPTTTALEVVEHTSIPTNVPANVPTPFASASNSPATCRSSAAVDVHGCSRTRQCVPPLARSLARSLVRRADCRTGGFIARGALSADLPRGDEGAKEPKTNATNQDTRTSKKIKDRTESRTNEKNQDQQSQAINRTQWDH